jgi:hypothetical protein
VKVLVRKPGGSVVSLPATVLPGTGGQVQFVGATLPEGTYQMVVKGLVDDVPFTSPTSGFECLVVEPNLNLVVVP